jgi:hypothetical protein
MDTLKRTGKVLEYLTYRGNPVIIYEYSYRNQKLVKNPKFNLVSKKSIPLMD